MFRKWATIVASTLFLVGCAREIPVETKVEEATEVQQAIGARVTIAWPFREDSANWWGWQGERSGGAYRQLACGYRHTHSGGDYYARDLSRTSYPYSGQPVYAGFSGQVIESRLAGGYGNTVVIYDASRKIAVRYAHLADRRFERGQWVTVYQRVGTVGDTGAPGSPHLHIAVYENVDHFVGGWPVVPTVCDSDWYACAVYFYAW